VQDEVQTRRTNDINYSVVEDGQVFTFTFALSEDERFFILLPEAPCSRPGLIIFTLFKGGLKA
jgi:hypothetical protein